MRVVFRADASHQIGKGHLTRCLTLAEALRDQGSECSFVCREDGGGGLYNVVEKSDFPVRRYHALPVASDTGAESGHEAPANAGWEEDAAQTRAAIDSLGGSAEWLVVDHYGLDARWESRLRTSAGRIMVIDDIANRPHDCDLLLDQNLVADMRNRYAGKVPAACRSMLGPQYALLQPEYARLRDHVSPRGGVVRRVMISFGGADACNLTGRALAACLRLDRPDIRVDAVISSNAPNARVVQELAAGRDNVQLHSDLPSLAPLMANADLAIGAGGSTSWERLCLGLPALVVTLAENQRAVAQELSARGLIRWLGHADVVDETAIVSALQNEIRQGVDEDWSRRCLAAVDGGGVNRVCAALTVSARSPLRARPATPEDEALLLEWANEPGTRRNAFSPDPIAADVHRTWFRSRLRDPGRCRLYVVETIDAVPLGQVRFEAAGKDWEVHYALSVIYRGRGFGRALLDTAVRRLHADAPGVSIFGRVKTANVPSRRVFESLGFVNMPDTEEGIVVYRHA